MAAMRHVLLISNSTLHGSGYLEHCADELRDFLGSRKTVLFVPYALHDWDGYADAAEGGYAKFGQALKSVHRAADPIAAVAEAEGLTAHRRAVEIRFEGDDR